MDFIYQLGGITQTDEQLQVAFKNNEGTTSFTSAALRVNDRVKIDDTIFADAFAFLKSTVTTAVPKLTDPVAQHGALPPAVRPPFDPTCLPDVEEFGPTSVPPTPKRSAVWESWGARISQTRRTRHSPTSTTRRNAK